MKKIAIIGGGVAGLSAAYALRDSATAVTIYEQNAHLGGHAHTLNFTHCGREVSVDVAFMVYNRRNYPVFCALLDALGVAGNNTEMSFSVAHQPLGITYNGGSLAGLVADKKNLLRGGFWKLMADILRFNRVAKNTLRGGGGGENENETLQTFLTRLRFSKIFCDAYLLPMGASIWSCSPAEFSCAPARFVLAFFHNHGLLDLRGRPQWQCVAGGSARYVEALTKRIPNLRVVHSAAQGVSQTGEVKTAAGPAEKFDAVIIAAHAPQALALLQNPSAAQKEILGAFRYTQTEGALHTDENLLPANRRARAAWNYRAEMQDGELVTYPTYYLSLLQGIAGEKPLLLSLNIKRARPAPESIIEKFYFSHPLPDVAAIAAQRRFAEINGGGGGGGKLFFCGAYWGNGFHEDGAASGKKAAGFAADFLRGGE